ncbi:hypothetical protein [Saccharopolyspora hattusasensis]|uniref:hypothetical protein n=1 Tax=Saccharopolyspora hattusasensis TaxID=1128679 RepID=UPI003D95B275
MTRISVAVLDLAGTTAREDGIVEAAVRAAVQTVTAGQTADRSAAIAAETADTSADSSELVRSGGHDVRAGRPQSLGQAHPALSHATADEAGISPRLAGFVSSHVEMNRP